MQLRLLQSATVTADARREASRPVRRGTAELAALGDGGMRFWRPLPRKVMDVICGEGAAPEVPLHAHEALQVMLPASPFAVLDGAGGCTAVYPGVIHITRPLELSAARRLEGEPINMRVLLVAAASVPELQAGPSARVVNDPELYDELWALFDDLRRPLVALDRGPRLRACLSRLLARPAERPGPEPAASTARGVERARDDLRAHAAESVSLDELASVAGLSKFYLLRAFRREYGLTPHAYQMQLRLARARRLIAEGRPLSYVTYEAGFADQSHFTRRFGAFFGLTPARFARQLAGSIDAAPRVPSVFGRAAATPPAA